MNGCDPGLHQLRYGQLGDEDAEEELEVCRARLRMVFLFFFEYLLFIFRLLNR